MENFLYETIEVLKENGKHESDVLFCKYGTECFSFNRFKEISNFEYDSSYGWQQAPCVNIVGEDWWLERGEYDGSEWWEFKQKPILTNIDDSFEFPKEDE